MGRLPETGPSLRRYLTQQKRQANRAGNASPFTRSGTSVTAENEVTVDGQMQSSDYDGTSRADLGTAGWMLGPDDGGASLLALNGIDVYANLAAMIASVITPDSGFATASNFAIPAGQANRVTRATFTLTVPAGFTKALVQAIAGSTGFNTSGSTDYLISYLEIGPTPASVDAPSPTCLNGTSTGSDVFRNVLIEGLSGGDPIVISIQPYTYANTWPISATNSVTVQATCLFMR